MTKNDGYREITNVEALGDLPGADRAKDLLRISLVDQSHTLTTALAAALASNGSDSLLIDPATGSTFTVTIDTDNVGLATETTLSALADALASNANDTIQTEQQTPVQIEDSNGTNIDPATETTLSNLAAALASNGGDTLQVDQQGVLDVSSRDGRNLGDVDVTSLPAADITDDDARVLGDVDVTAVSDTAQTSDSTTATGGSSAAQIDLGALRKDVDIFYETTGAATITIEVSTDTSTWRQFQTISPSSSESDIVQIDTAYQHVRVSADQNLSVIEVVARGG